MPAMHLHANEHLTLTKVKQETTEQWIGRHLDYKFDGIRQTLGKSSRETESLPVPNIAMATGAL